MVYKLKVQDPFCVNAPVASLHPGGRWLPKTVASSVNAFPRAPGRPLRGEAGGCGAGSGGGGEGCCHFKMPADWSVNMDKIGADSWVCESVSERERAHACEILTSGPVVKNQEIQTAIYTDLHPLYIFFTKIH